MEIKIDRLIRSKRRTYLLEISPDGELIVRVPKRLSRQAVERVVAQKAAWIIKHQTKAREQIKAIRIRNFTPGETLPLLGREYPIQSVPTGRKAAEFKEQAFRLKENAKDPQKALEKCYREKACEIFTQRLQLYAQALGFQYRQIRISGARKRWGSCSSRGCISLAWRLLAAPLEIVDYVAVHELLHLKIKNHSPKFWQELEKIYPGAHQARKWLRENQGKLTWS